MAQKIDIGVNAKLDTSGAQKDAQALGKTLEGAAKIKLDPISNSALSKLDKANQAFQQFLKLDRELARRIKASGQDGVAFADLDWSRTHPDARARKAKRRQVEEFIGAGGGGGGGDGGGGRGGWRQAAGGMAVNAAQAGLRSAGPAGGVAAGALGTGMSAGFGAGLMGLAGGILALGVGKLVGGIAEKVEQAENNNIQFDKLKRVTGDVGVAFSALKTMLMQTGDGLKITYDESERLATSFAKQGNVRGQGYKSLSEELGIGVGMSRAYGLDPSQGVGFMGQLRGVGVTRDAQDSRRTALLIGETIAKSDAFAKADEVLEAISGFATAQTRQSLTAANLSGYTGMFSAMVGSGMPGMDPAGAAGILARMNSSLSAGGAKGEASQFFTSMVGNRMGLDPLQMQVLREGGAFATRDSMFGKGSPYASYMGGPGPGGSETFLTATRKLIEEKYAGDGQQQKMLRASAFANHTGINLNQSMAMLSLQPNQMGEMQKYAGDMSKLSASGIRNMSAALFGSDDERQALAQQFSSRDDVSGADKDRLRTAMASGDKEQQKEVLARLSAQYEQEKTMGSDIRDTRASVDNIKTKMADAVVPALNDIRKGIIWMAGGKDGKTMAQIGAEVDKNEAKGNYDAQRTGINSERGELAAQRRKLGTDLKSGKIEFGEYLKGRQAIDARSKELDKAFDGAQSEYNGRMKEIEGRSSARAPGAGQTPAGTQNAAPATGGGGAQGIDAIEAAEEKRAGLPSGALKAIRLQETGGKQEYLDNPSKYHYPLNADGQRIAGHTGKVSTAFGPYGILESTGKKPGYGVKSLDGKDLQEQSRFAADYLAARAKSAGSFGAGLAGYGEGWRYSTSVQRRIAKIQAERAAAPKVPSTPIPDEKSSQAPRLGSGNYGMTQQEFNNRFVLDVNPLTVQHVGPNGQKVKPDETLSTRVTAPNPDTYRSFVGQ